MTENSNIEKQARNALMSAIVFTKDDLAANKQGRLSGSQKQTMEEDFAQSELRGKKIVAFAWVFVIIFVFLIIAVGLPNQLMSRASKPSVEGDQLRWAVLGIGSVCFVIAVGAVFFLYVIKLGRRNARIDLPVHSVSGVVEKSSLESWYTLSIGGRDFVSSEPDDPVHAVFVTGQAYSIFYVFNTANIIVSAEEVQE